MTFCGTFPGEATGFSEVPSSVKAVQVLLAVGIPVKVNIDSGGKPNGIPERR